MALPIKHPIVAAAATPTFSGYWFTDSTGLVSNFGQASYYGSAPSPLFRPIVGMAEAPGTGAFFGRIVPVGVLWLRHQQFPVQRQLPDRRPPDRDRASRRQSSSNANPCLAQEAAWAGGGLNLYTFLNYETSATSEPGCNGDAACNAGYQAGIHAYTDAVGAGVNAGVPWWLDVETNRSPAWSTSTQENAHFVQGALNALHETEGVADVGIYASPGVWNDIVGDYTPSVPYWMADYLPSPSGPGSCADYQNWVTNHGAQLPGPPEIVQYNMPRPTTRTTPAKWATARTPRAA